MDRGKPEKSRNQRVKHRPSDRPQSKHKTAPSDRVWIYGLHAVAAAIANPARQIHRIIATANGHIHIESAVSANHPAPEVVSPAELSQILPDGAVHQGLGALAATLPAVELADISATGLGRIVVLDQVTDPHNVGAILRSCAAFGVSGMVVQRRHSPQLAGALAKAASGGLELVPIVEVTNVSRALEEIGKAGYVRIGLAEDAATDLSEAEIGASIALVLGAEGRGLRRLVAEKCDLMLRIPTQPNLPSLNVSNAAAVALYALSSKSGA